MTEIKKIDLNSLDIKTTKLEELKKLFPDLFVEGKLNMDALQRELGEWVDPDKERFGLVWSGKSDCMKVIQQASIGTLLPKRKDSLNFDESKNLIIEGDNLEVLKLLQKSYYGKVKIIYIDPPYNTGKEFIYPDNFHEGLQEYLRRTEQVDGNGFKLNTNTDSSGRYHTNWLNMMYPRLYLARNLLKDDGVIFMNIGDAEIDNLKKISDEIFGEDNFIAVAIWEKKNKGAFLAKDITNMKDYVVIYAKDKEKFNGLIGQIAEEEETYPCVNAPNAREIRKIPAGIKSKYREKSYKLEKGNTISADTMSLVLHSDLIIEDGVLAKELIIEGNWRYKQEAMTEYAEKGELYLTQDLYLRRVVKEPRLKTLRDILPRIGTSGQPASLSFDTKNLFADGWGTNEDANEELRQLLGEQNIFDYPKPVVLIAKLLCSVRDESALVLDFFAGSGTTAHSVNLLNSIDGGTRKFILVQLPEKVEHEKFPTVSSITRERVKAVYGSNSGDLLKSHKEENYGFKAFSLDSSNFSLWANESTDPQSLSESLKLFAEHINTDRTAEDVLYEILLKAGFELTVTIKKLLIANKEVFSIEDGAMLICLDRDLSIQVVEEMLELHPFQIICLDEGFKGNDQLKVNVIQTIKSRQENEDIKTIFKVV